MHSVDPKLFTGKTFDIKYSEIPKATNLVVITGGEPCLFDLMEIRSHLLQINPKIQIEVESNATVFPDFDLKLFKWNLSPKLSSSLQKTKNQNELRLKNLGLWSEFASKNPNLVIYKFVVGSVDDFNEILDIKNQFNLSANAIYVMPEGQTNDSQLGPFAKDIVSFVKKYQFNFTPRLHVLLWGDKRGV